MVVTWWIVAFFAQYHSAHYLWNSIFFSFLFSTIIALFCVINLRKKRNSPFFSSLPFLLKTSATHMAISYLSLSLSSIQNFSMAQDCLVSVHAPFLLIFLLLSRVFSWAIIQGTHNTLAQDVTIIQSITRGMLGNAKDAGKCKECWEM